MDDTAELTTALTLNDIVKMGYLPAGCVPLDCVLVADSLDSSGDTIQLAVGILNDDEDDPVTAKTFITDASANATVTVTRTDSDATGMLALTPDDDDDQIVAVKVTTAAGTAVAGGVRVILTYRASNLGA
jgi:hypothetical protein